MDFRHAKPSADRGPITCFHSSKFWFLCETFLFPVWRFPEKTEEYYYTEYDENLTESGDYYYDNYEDGGGGGGGGGAGGAGEGKSYKSLDTTASVL